MEFVLLAVNPATGTQLPLPLFIISGVVLAGCVVVGVITNMKKKKGGKNGKNSRNRNNTRRK